MTVEVLVQSKSQFFLLQCMALSIISLIVIFKMLSLKDRCKGEKANFNLQAMTALVCCKLKIHLTFRKVRNSIMISGSLLIFFLSIPAKDRCPRDIPVFFLMKNLPTKPYIPVLNHNQWYLTQGYILIAIKVPLTPLLISPEMHGPHCGCILGWTSKNKCKFIYCTGVLRQEYPGL